MVNFRRLLGSHAEPNPYSILALTTTRPDYSFCDSCNHEVLTKDMHGHLRSKKHAGVIKALKAAAKESTKKANETHGTSFAVHVGRNKHSNFHLPISAPIPIKRNDSPKRSSTSKPVDTPKREETPPPENPFSDEYVIGGRYDGGNDDNDEDREEGIFNMSEDDDDKLSDMENRFTPIRPGRRVPSSADSGTECVLCHESGHISSECPKKPQKVAAGGGNPACWRCGNEDHFVRECPRKSSKSSVAAGNSTCRKCGAGGHLARDCPQKSSKTSVAGGSFTCRKCGEEGHFARECPKADDNIECYNCHAIGHKADNCPKEEDAIRKRATCYKCSMIGHYAKDCALPDNGTGARLCFSCGEEGHEIAGCPNRDRTCYRCGGEGHYARECIDGPSGFLPARDDRGPRCYTCYTYGHKMADCPLTSTDDGYGAHGGYDSFSDLLPFAKRTSVAEGASDEQEAASEEAPVNTWDKEW